MKNKLTWRWVLIGVVVAAAVYFMWPPREKVHLGLDLRGGIHLVLQVNTGDAVRAEVDNAMERVRAALAEKNMAPAEFTPFAEGGAGFRFRPAPGTDRDVLETVLEERLGEFTIDPGAAYTATLRPEVARNIRDMSVRQALETIRNRIDQFGVAEPQIQRQGLEGDRIVVQLPGVDDPGRVKDLIRATAFLEIRPVIQMGPNPDTIRAQVGGNVPADAEILPGEVETFEGQTSRQYYLVKRASVVTGRDLGPGSRSQGQYNDPVVRFTLTPDGGRKFGDYTGANIGQQMAIVLDGKVRSAPVIRGQIHDEGIIEGSFTIESAEDLALVLRAGALPASITYLEERTVGPSLGRDSIVRGIRAGLIGLAFIVAFMLLYYRAAGLNADVALVLNAVILIGGMAALGATLTLPGIAGIILTIGMAVDSNVLIFERIREELELGKTIRNAVDLGFQRALSAIIDSNLTTIVSALFLFQFGTGPIKGFAVTLTLGLLISLFTSVFVSRTIFETILSRRTQAKTLSI